MRAARCPQLRRKRLPRLQPCRVSRIQPAPFFDGCALSVPRVAINLSKSRAPHVSVRLHGPSMRAVSRLVNDSGEAFMHWQMRAVLLHLVTSRSLAFARQSPCAARLDPVGPVRPDHESFDRAEFQGWSHNLTKLECFIFTTRTTFGGA